MGQLADLRHRRVGPDPLQFAGINATETCVPTSAERAALVGLIREIARRIGVEGVMQALAGRGVEWV